MNIAKYLFISVLFFSSINFSKAECIECLKKKADNIEGMPGNKSIETLAAATKKLAQKVSTKESYQESYCLKYGMAEDTVDVETIFEEMDASPFPNSMVEFWTAPVCRAPQKLDSKVPMIFNTAENVHQAENFPKAIREYLLEVKHDPATWLKIINSKSSDGLTFLDYMYYSINHNMYTIQETKEAAQRIVNYICKNGGLYSKYKDDVKCQ